MSEMISKCNQPRHLVLNIDLCVALVCSLLPCPVYGQAMQGQPDMVDAAIARVRSGDFHPVDIVVLADARAIRAVPALEEQFTRAKDDNTKADIASGLVRLGDKDNTYWNFLLEQATLAVDSDVPDALYDSQGKMMERQAPPELKAWAQAHHVPLNSAGILAMRDLPGKVILLGASGDPRGIPLLRRALQSHNSLIVIAAANGLATIHDKDSIPSIIAACRKAPVASGLAPVIARSLVYFDDPEAQSAVDTYMRRNDAQDAREARARGRQPFGDKNQ